MALITRAGRLLISGGALTNDQGCCCGGGNGNPCTVNGEVCDCVFPTISRSDRSELLPCGVFGWTRSQLWWGSFASFFTNNGWAWKEGYPQKLQGCRAQWLQDERQINCCSASFPGLSNSQCNITFRRYTLYAVNCDSQQIVDITAEAVTKNPEFVPNLSTFSNASQCGVCGDDPGFFPPPVIEPRCPCSVLGCDGSRFNVAILTIKNNIFNSHDPNNPYTTHCPPYYDEWQRLFEDNLDGTFALQKDPAQSGPTSSTFRLDIPMALPPICNPQINEGGVYIQVSIGFSPTSFGPCLANISSFAGLIVPATRENCQIAFDFNGSFRYTTTPGGCWLNSRDCPPFPGYQATAFSSTSVGGLNLPSVDVCGDQPQVAWQAPPTFIGGGGQINSCNQFRVGTDWELTLQ